MDGNRLLASQGSSDPVNRPYIVKAWKSGANWYRLYSDGWCEQGGNIITTNLFEMKKINLHIPYLNNDYFVSVQSITSSTSFIREKAEVSDFEINSYKNDSFVAWVAFSWMTNLVWSAKGYVSESIVSQYK